MLSAVISARYSLPYANYLSLRSYEQRSRAASYCDSYSGFFQIITHASREQHRSDRTYLRKIAPLALVSAIWAPSSSVLIRWRFSARFERDWKLSSTAALFFCLTLAQLLRFPGRRSHVDFGCVFAGSDCSSFLLWPNMIMMCSPFSLAVVVKQSQLWASRAFLKANVAWLRFGTIIGYAEREFGRTI